MEYGELAGDVVEALRTICLGLPEAHEEVAWAGLRWCVRKRTFAHVLAIVAEHPRAIALAARDGATPEEVTTILTFRSSGAELGALRASGHPFFTPGWGSDTVGMVVDDAVDWDEVGELLTESYCLFAPKKLVALVDRPPPSEDDGFEPDDLPG